MTIQPLSLDSTTGELKDTLSAIKIKLGMIPNMFAVMAKAPAVLNSYLQVSENLKGGKISAALGEQIAIALANKNACEYCLSAHSTIGKMVGVAPNELAAAQSGKARDPKNQAAIDFALAINANHGDGAAMATKQALAKGLSEQEVLEIAAHVALNILTNSVNGLSETTVDFPKVSLNKLAA